MSAASKATLLATVTGAAAVIAYVHLNQVKDQEKLHKAGTKGVVVFRFGE